MDPLRVAIVGTGLMGRWHADAATRAGGRIVHVVDRDVARADAFARRFRWCRPSTSSLSVDAGRIDVVHICTPTASHEALAEQALQNRIHVLVEKPLAETATATMRLYDLAASERVLLCPVHQFPFQSGVRQIAAALPHMAPVRHLDMITCSAGAADRADDERDAVAIDIVPHFASVVARLWPAALAARWHIERPHAGEIRMVASAGGATVSLLVSMSGRPTTNSLRVIGHGGTAMADLFHGFAVRYDPSVSRVHKIVQPFTQSAATARAAAVNLIGRAIRGNTAYPGLRTLVQGFYRAIRTGGDAPISRAEAVAAAVLRDAVVRFIATPVGGAFDGARR